MRILALNHFFDQDLEALRREAGERHSIRTIHFSYFRERFLRLFPEEVLGLDFSLFGSPRYTEARHKWREQAQQALCELYQLDPFDVLVLPSDIFPYVRDLVPAAHALGVPAVVCQKETTLAPVTMAEHSELLGEYFPFVSDHMAVCSERHRQFWLKAGADPTRVEVTGQPRFDFYGKPEQWRSLQEMGVSVLPDRKVILFLSYALSAYVPQEDRGTQPRYWEPLRSATERALLDVVNQGEHQLLVKPHPQQGLDDGEAIRRMLRDQVKVPGSAQVLPPSADTRHLLVNADIIVGFQTTALLEALLLHRPIIHAAWGAEYEALRDKILPFQDHPEAMHTASSPQELVEFVTAGTQDGVLSDSGRNALYEEHLGPGDGRASERILATLERAVSAHPVEDPAAVQALRKQLAADRGLFLLGQCARLAAELTLDLPMTAAATALSRVSGDGRGERWARQQLALRLDHARELTSSLTGKAPHTEQLTGRRLNPWLRGAGHLLRSKGMLPGK